MPVERLCNLKERGDAMARPPAVPVMKEQIGINPKGEVVIKNDELRKKVERFLATPGLSHNDPADFLDNCDCHCGGN